MNKTVFACEYLWLLVTYECIMKLQKTFLLFEGCLTFKVLKTSFQPYYKWWLLLATYMV